uniref:Uncharacterized protein n=1 Tax=Candidatus Kentrum sp. TUN TaxID=2126343 RepID=A0A451A3W5_9GAMM|nr:MAG: hypothetical protein BECKTUN1418D_GA0071000_113311 [Candidatus Kentron sp. TUN]
MLPFHRNSIRINSRKQQIRLSTHIGGAYTGRVLKKAIAFAKKVGTRYANRMNMSALRAETERELASLTHGFCQDFCFSDTLKTLRYPARQVSTVISDSK